MTLENSKRLVEHYKKLIENPDLAFETNARVKPQARESVIEHAKKHLEDMEENIKIREYIKANPDKKLNPATVLKKLKVPEEAVEKDVLPKEPTKKKSKKSE